MHSGKRLNNDIQQEQEQEQNNCITMEYVPVLFWLDVVVTQIQNIQGMHGISNNAQHTSISKKRKPICIGSRPGTHLDGVKGMADDDGCASRQSARNEVLKEGDLVFVEVGVIEELLLGQRLLLPLDLLETRRVAPSEFVFTTVVQVSLARLHIDMVSSLLPLPFVLSSFVLSVDAGRDTVVTSDCACVCR